MAFDRMLVGPRQRQDARRRIGDLLLALDNAALSELVFSSGRGSLRSFNSTSHLPAELTSRI
ncbi:hypothetical protein [Marinobacter sp. NFXS9]|uniref:hypothetical protein n=1 Tax=Marinobacter sp. NFXS9 TaxID=2818433 RepID=UPI0032DF651D